MASGPQPSSRRWRWVLPVAISVVGIAALVYFLAPYRSDIRTAADRASAWTLVGITLLSLVALAARTEVWRSGLAAADRHPPRTDLHAANAASFLASLANHYVAPGVKMWLLRRMEGERAAYLLKLATIELATTLLEGLLAAALVVFAAFQTTLPWWLPVLLASGVSVLLVAAVVARARHPDHPLVAGLGVLLRARYRWEVLGLLTIVFGVQIVRTWISLRSVGAHIGLGDAMLVFVVTGVLGILPSGVTAAPTAASLIIVGSKGIGDAAASGILVTGSLVVATVLDRVLAGGARWLARRGPAPAAAPLEHHG